MSDRIFGFTWEEIQAAQRGGRLPRGTLVGAPTGRADPTAEDHRLLAEHGADGLRRLGMIGVLDRLRLPFTAPAAAEDATAPAAAEDATTADDAQKDGRP